MAQPAKPVIRVYPDYATLCAAVAEEFVKCSAQAIGRKDRVAIALSGGETPKGFYEVLARECVDRIAWEKVDLFWSDERYVHQRDARSNFRMFHEALLHRVRIPLDHIHPMPTHRRRAADAADDYERYLRSVFSGEWPRLDVVLLGMGADGHTASIFPGSRALGDTGRWVMAVEGPAEPRTRLTFTLPVLNAAADVCFLVAGERKAEALGRVFHGNGDPPPAAAVRPTDGRLVWWVDAAAFSRVDEAKMPDCDVVRLD